MKPLYTQLEFDKAKSEDKLACECYYCHSSFLAKKKLINLNLKKHINKNNNFENSCKYCSKKCQFESQIKKQEVNCKQCSNTFLKSLSEIKKYPNHFCSRSCAATYNNINKTHGTRRSKLEMWLEEQLIILYPGLHIDFNKKTAINSELDIYIPSLRLAFELNGVFHYEPIFGSNKLEQIQTNDISKSKACIDAKIDLCIIDTSQQKYVKPKTSKKFLDIIINIINERLKSLEK